MAKKYLTLNIGAATVELAEYEAGGKGALTLVKYGTATLAASLDGGNAETILVPSLMDIMRETGIKPGKVALSLSGQMVFPRFAAIPHTGDDAKFEQMIRYEVEQNIPFPIDEMVCDRQVIGDTENGDKSVMIVAAKVDQVESIAAAVQSAGFTLEIVDVAPIALINAIRANHPEESGCVVALDIGAKTTSLVIVEGDKIYNRSIPVAGNSITKEIVAAIGCSPEEAEQLKREKGYVSIGGVSEDEDAISDRVSKVCRAVMTRINAEVSRSVNFYRSQQQGGAPVKLYLTGGTALLPQIDQFFAESLGIEVEFLNPFETIAFGSGIDEEAIAADAAFLSATAGLALHMAGLSVFSINLLPPSLVEARAGKAKIPFLVVGGLAFVMGLALVMLAIRHEAAVIGAQRDAVQAKVDALTSFDKKVTAAQKAVDQAQEDAEDLRKLMSARGRAVQRVNAVRESLLPGMWIERWESGKVTIRSWRDRVKGAGGKTAGEIVVDKLKGKAAVEASSVKILDMSAVGKDSQVEQFTVEVMFK